MSINLSVTVDENGNPSVTPDEVTVPKKERNVKLIWAMQTPGYEISDITGLPATEFTERAKRGTGYEVKDKNDDANSYPYTVVVRRQATGREFAVDPTIKNQG